MTFHAPNKLRKRTGKYATTDEAGNNGLFIIKTDTYELRLTASDARGWEHVAVAAPNRNPTWDEMCQVKDLFWDHEDTAVQYHVPAIEHRNMPRYCLHLWRPVGLDIPRPPPPAIRVVDPTPTEEKP